MSRGSVLPDEMWARIEPLMPPVKVRWGRRGRRTGKSLKG